MDLQTCTLFLNDIIELGDSVTIQVDLKNKISEDLLHTRLSERFVRVLIFYFNSFICEHFVSVIILKQEQKDFLYLIIFCRGSSTFVEANFKTLSIHKPFQTLCKGPCKICGYKQTDTQTKYVYRLITSQNEKSEGDISHRP